MPLVKTLSFLPDELLKPLLGLLEFEEGGVHVLPLLVLELQPRQPLGVLVLKGPFLCNIQKKI